MQTMSGTLKGKFAYMAPEYIAGQIDARADLFAIGVIAHELLTNRPLFSGRDDIDTLSRVRDMHIAPPSHKNPRVPPEIDDIVMTALARDPDRRWQHATALRTALTTLTKRLDLVASNAQVVEWLDWAFLHTGRVPQRGDRSDNDTETDGQPINDDPSISIEPCTVQLLSINQKITLVTPHGDPAPSGAMPAGTPDHMPAQRPRSSPISEGSRPEVTVRGNALRPRAPTGPVAGPVAAPVARSSSRIALRPVAPTVGSPSGPSVPSLPTPPGGRPSSTVLGTSAPPVRAARVSSPPAIHPNAVPISAALAAHLSAAQALTSAAGAPPPVRSAADLADPGDPAANLTPFAAPRAHAPTAGPPQSYDAMRSAVSQHELAQRGSAAPGAATAVRRSSRVLAVVLVVLAAAIAAITVYFVLPLLT
jgi:serine/threonine-protein kinase